MDKARRQHDATMTSGGAENSDEPRAVEFNTLIREIKDLAIFTMDLQGRPTTWNEGVQRLLGFTEAEFVGHHVNRIIFIPEDLENRIPEKELEYAAQHGSASDDRWLRRKDGTRFYASGFTTALYRDGQVIGYTKAFRDLTEMKQTELALRESQERLRIILDAATDYAIVITDADGKVSTWSRGAQEVFGYSAEEIMGRDSRVLFTPEDQAAKYPERERELAARDGRAINERWQIRKDGSRFWASGVAHCIYRAEGQPRAFLKILRDQTEQRLSEERLEHTVADRTARLRETVGELEAFSYSIAHDMRAPLRAMQGFANMLTAELGNKVSSKAADYLRRISMSANRLDQLIQEVLNYSKVVRSDLALLPLNPAELIQEIVESYPNLQPPKAAISVEGRLPLVLANHAALTQVIANLLGNAVKFVAPGVHPKVRIWAEELEPVPGEPPWVKIWFEDNGIGISEGARDRIFQMFQRLNPQSRYEGTGMGLAIVRKGMERMGGKVGVDSPPAGGSRFWIMLKGAPPK